KKFTSTITMTDVLVGSPGSASGIVESSKGACEKGRKVTVKDATSDVALGTTKTTATGSWTLPITVEHKELSAVVAKKVLRLASGRKQVCLPDTIVPPTVTITQPADGSTTGGTGSIVYVVTDAASVTCTLDAAPTPCTQTGHDFALLASGPHSFEFTATSAWGFARSDDVSWTVDATAAFGLVINEVDYDQPSTDTTEFIEVLNIGAETLSLTGVTVKLVNGATGLIYASFDLGAVAPTLPTGGYIVIANDAVVVPGGVPRISMTDSLFQNGAPDGLAIVDGSNTVLDRFSYEGETISADFGSLVEGTATAQIDEGVGDGSLVRSPDGADTDNAIVDWSSSTIPTPGQSNSV
ncbi:MAG: lamin tail domain-containing protein, partial [Actinomycetota bacterium]